MRRMMLTILGLMAFASLAATGSSPLPTQTSVEPGVWCSDYAAAKAYADANNVPMLVFWANPSCHYCGLLEDACTQSDFTTWQAARKMVMVFSYGDAAVKKIVKNETGEYPYLMVYWQRSAAGQTVEERFTGRAGRFPQPAVKTDALGKQLTDVVDDLTTGWDPDAQKVTGYTGGVFTVPDTATARLEILPTTEKVLVPLMRTNGVSRAAVNTLCVGADWSTEVSWAKGESEKFVEVPVSGGVVGGAIALTLLQTNALVATSAIHVVAEPANSPKNPKWIGESFNFGEWTMDLDAAKAMTAAADGDAATIVFFTGSLWCPWCLALENNVLDTDEFRALMKENQVSLALIDETKRSPNDNTGSEPYAVTTVANGAAPTLLRYTVGANGNSGASYLSRKGISRADAEAKLLYNTRIGYPGGTYCAPEAVRTGYPTFILLDKAGNIKARFVYQADSSAGKDAQGAYRADKAENLQRFRDFIALAKDASVVESDKYYSTTSLSHAIGTTTAAELHVSANTLSYRLTGANAHHVSFMAGQDSADRGVTFTIVKAGTAKVTRKDAAGLAVDTVTISQGTVVATGDRSLECDLPASGDYYLRVSSYADYLTARYGSTGTVTRIVFASTGIPLETENDYVKTAFTVQGALLAEGEASAVMTVTSTAKGKITVRYVRPTGGTVSLTGVWSEPDDFGVSTLTLAKRGIAVALTLTADGKITGTVQDAKIGDGTLAFASSAKALDYASYMGVYTVVLPVIKTGDLELFPYGAGIVLVKANTATVRKSGKVTCAVTFPNGTKASATGYLTAGDAGFANLTIEAKSGKNRMVLPMQIRPDAVDATTHRAVNIQPGTSAFWESTQTGYAFTREVGIYGSCYDSKESLLDCCGTDALAVDFDADLLTPSTKHGAITAINGQGAATTMTARQIKRQGRVLKFSLSTNRTSGTVYGRALVTFADGYSEMASFIGAIIPDWRDCGCFEEDETVPLAMDLPFVYGTLYFADQADKTKITRSLPFGLVDAE